jgi:large subunit ribosomal protein L16
MLTPKRVKYRKMMVGGKIAKQTTVAHTLIFGKFGLKAQESKWVTARQLESARRAITRCIHRGGELWIRIFPDKPITKQPPETGMGGGKGAVDHFVAVCPAGRIIFELDGVPQEIAKKAFKLAAHKLPLATAFISKEG